MRKLVHLLVNDECIPLAILFQKEEFLQQYIDDIIWLISQHGLNTLKQSGISVMYHAATFSYSFSVENETGNACIVTQSRKVVTVRDFTLVANVFDHK